MYHKTTINRQKRHMFDVSICEIWHKCFLSIKFEALLTDQNDYFVTNIK